MSIKSVKFEPSQSPMTSANQDGVELSQVKSESSQVEVKSVRSELSQSSQSCVGVKSEQN